MAGLQQESCKLCSSCLAREKKINKVFLAVLEAIFCLFGGFCLSLPFMKDPTHLTQTEIYVRVRILGSSEVQELAKQNTVLIFFLCPLNNNS